MTEIAINKKKFNLSNKRFYNSSLIKLDSTKSNNLNVERQCDGKLDQIKVVIFTVSFESPSIPFKLCNLFCTTDNHFKFTQDFKPFNSHIE